MRLGSLDMAARATVRAWGEGDRPLSEQMRMRKYGVVKTANEEAVEQSSCEEDLATSVVLSSWRMVPLPPTSYGPVSTGLRAACSTLNRYPGSSQPVRRLYTTQSQPRPHYYCIFTITRGDMDAKPQTVTPCGGLIPSSVPSSNICMFRR